MEEAFNKLKSSGKNTVDGAVEWIKEAKLIDGKNITETTVRKCFEDVGVKANEKMEFDKFSAAIKEVAKVAKTNFEQVSKALQDHSENMFKTAKDMVTNTAQAGVSAIKNIFK